MSKILVAEDNLPNRELIREILENSGYEVIEADDGQQALDKLATTEADLGRPSITARSPTIAPEVRIATICSLTCGDTKATLSRPPNALTPPR